MGGYGGIDPGVLRQMYTDPGIWAQYLGAVMPGVQYGQTRLRPGVALSGFGQAYQQGRQQKILGELVPQATGQFRPPSGAPTDQLVPYEEPITEERMPEGYPALGGPPITRREAKPIRAIQAAQEVPGVVGPEAFGKVTRPPLTARAKFYTQPSIGGPTLAEFVSGRSPAEISALLEGAGPGRLSPALTLIEGARAGAESQWEKQRLQGLRDIMGEAVERYAENSDDVEARQTVMQLLAEPAVGAKVALDVAQSARAQAYLGPLLKKHGLDPEMARRDPQMAREMFGYVFQRDDRLRMQKEQFNAVIGMAKAAGIPQEIINEASEAVANGAPNITLELLQNHAQVRETNRVYKEPVVKDVMMGMMLKTAADKAAFAKVIEGSPMHAKDLSAAALRAEQMDLERRSVTSREQQVEFERDRVPVVGARDAYRIAQDDFTNFTFGQTGMVMKQQNPKAWEQQSRLLEGMVDARRREYEIINKRFLAKHLPAAYLESGDLQVMAEIQRIVKSDENPSMKMERLGMTLQRLLADPTLKTPEGQKTVQRLRAVIEEAVQDETQKIRTASEAVPSLRPPVPTAPRAIPGPPGMRPTEEQGPVMQLSDLFKPPVEAPDVMAQREQELDAVAFDLMKKSWKDPSLTDSDRARIGREWAERRRRGP